jgi:hypothetical protein
MLALLLTKSARGHIMIRLKLHCSMAHQQMLVLLQTVAYLSTWETERRRISRKQMKN